MDSNIYFLGMNMVWWTIWAILIIWIFVIPYDIPFQRKGSDSPKNILKKRLANGQITKQEYQHILTTLNR